MEQLPRSLIHGGRRIDLSRIPRRYRPRLVAGLLILVAIGVGLAAFTVLRQAHETPSAALAITSAPSNATVEVDGRKRGQTPLTLALGARDHEIALHRADYADALYDVSLTAGVTTTLHADLWLRSPRLQRLRPALPGASIHHANFLVDGRVILILSLPPGDERQAWVLAGSQTERLGPSNVQGSLAVSLDAQQVAYLARGNKTGVTSRLDEVWIATAQGDKRERRYSLPTTASADSLVDVAWASDGGGLLLVSQQRVSGGGVRTALRWLDVGAGGARDLVSLAIGAQAAVPEPRRRHVTLIVDEFHTLPSVDYEAILSEQAKYGANLILATQSLARLEANTQDGGPSLRAVLFANLDGLFAFQTSAEDAEYLVRELGAGIEIDDLISLSHYHCYASLMVNGERLPTFSLRLDAPPAPDAELALRLAHQSAQRYGRPANRVDAELVARLGRVEAARRTEGKPVQSAGTGQGKPHDPREGHERKQEKDQLGQSKPKRNEHRSKREQRDTRRVTLASAPSEPSLSDEDGTMSDQEVDK